MLLRILSEIWNYYRKRIIAAAALAVTAAVLLILDSVYFTGALADKRRAWGEYRQGLKSNPSAEKAARYDSAAAEIRLFDDRIPDLKDFARIIGDIFTAAENSSLSVGGVTYKPGKSQQGYLLYSFNIDVSGSYPALKSFLVDILKYQGIVSVENVSFSKSGRIFEDEVSMKAALNMMFRESSK